MKSKINNLLHTGNLRRSLMAVSLCTGLAVGLSSSPLRADTEWEWEPGEGYHEEEWYDPSDWFNEDNQISYETGDNWGYGNNDSWGYDDTYASEDTWGYDYGYNYDYDDTLGYGYDYDSTVAGTDDDYDAGLIGENEADTDWSIADDNTNTATYGTDDYRWNDVTEEWVYTGPQTTRQTARQRSQQNQQMQADQQRRQQMQANQQRREQMQANQQRRQQSRQMQADQLRQQMQANQQRRQQDRQMQADQQRRQRDQQMQSSQQGHRQNQQAQAQAGSQQRQQQSGQQAQRQNVRFEGTIDGFQRVNLKTSGGQQEKHHFVKVRLQNDESRVISLGTDVEVQELGLNKGDRIRVTGKTARVDGRQVLIADRIQAGDRQEFAIKSSNQPRTGQSGQTAQSGQSSQSQQAALQGTIRDFREVNLDGANEQNLLIRLQLQNGQTRVVDLGRNTTLGDLNLEQGDRVSVRGETRSINGNRVIVARQLRVDGEKTNIQRRGSQQSQDQDS